MYRAGAHDDTGSWYRISLGKFTEGDEAERFMELCMKWCNKHVSNGRWDEIKENGSTIFVFEQQEDSLMFRMWIKPII